MPKHRIRSKGKKRFLAEEQSLDGHVSKKHSRNIKKTDRQDARKQIRDSINASKESDKD